MYAVNEGVEPIILTNAKIWQVHHLTGGLPIVVDLALEIDLLGDAGPSAKADQLFYLSPEAMKHHLVDEPWKAKAATSPKALTAVLLSNSVIDSVRKEVRRQSGVNADTEEIVQLLRTEVRRSEALG